MQRDQPVETLSCRDIMSLLPHRHPFLLLDRVIECIPGSSIIGIKSTTTAQPDIRRYKGESWTSPLMLIESLAQLSVVLTFRSLDIVPSGRELFFFAGIDRARFVDGVRAGETVLLHSKVVRLLKSRGIGIFATTATVDGKTCVEATLMAVLQVNAKGAG